MVRPGGVGPPAGADRGGGDRRGGATGAGRVGRAGGLRPGGPGPPPSGPEAVGHGCTLTPGRGSISRRRSWSDRVVLCDTFANAPLRREASGADPLVLDASGSMLFGDKISKLEYVQYLATALAEVIGWHQDQAYWIDTDDRRTATCWLAVDDSTLDNGCLQFLPGSHRQPVRPHHPLHGDRGTSRSPRRPPPSTGRPASPLPARGRSRRPSDRGRPSPRESTCRSR